MTEKVREIPPRERAGVPPTLDVSPLERYKDPVKPIAPLRGTVQLALALGGLAAACGGGTPPPVTKATAAEKSIPFRPRPGVEVVECPLKSDDCASTGPEACEAACGDGDMAACVALAEWHKKHPNEGGKPERGMELLRMTCEKGFAWGCLTLAQQKEATTDDRARIEARLAEACGRDPRCGCWMYGSGLSFDPRTEVRGVETLGEACARGAQTACDELEILVEICERDQTRGGFCGRLREAQRLRPPAPSPPQWSQAPLPAALAGCFRVRAPGGPREPEGFGVGTLYCFTEGQAFMKPVGEPWDAWPARWSSTSEKIVFRNEAVRELMELRQEKPEIILQRGGFSAWLERLAGPEAEAALAETAALPALEEACARASRCVSALPYGYDGLMPETLRECLSMEKGAREMIEGERGKEAAEKACR
ncbi:hypothetical protein [Polyangium sorediatum]|uniref:Beta-lactamase n=1 Tax=Polyangium sorediatum TaxID=889274 RepID=A0ABT6P2K9_9BACT|nr:hypothetical protein [Polyangium sorediatum]MDI1434818.1 hypothetical protein [Polyangium sorediatum]